MQTGSRTYQNSTFQNYLTFEKSVSNACIAYIYGFQGQEADDEIKGEGNSYNYTYRMHDPRIGRFFAIDPLAPEYPYYTPYSFSGNEVIHTFELEGLEPNNSLLINANIGKTFQAASAASGQEGKIFNYTLKSNEDKTILTWSQGDEYTGPTKTESAEISNHSYKLRIIGYDAGGANDKVSNTEFYLQKEYGGSKGFKAGLYKRTIDGVDFYVFGTAGTDDAFDGITDVRQALGKLEPQVFISLIYAKRVDKWVKQVGGHLSFTGHSLGGGLAAANAKATGRTAITFNAMGLHSLTIRMYGLNGEKSKLAKIDAYIIKNEIVNFAQIFKADGTKHFIKSKTLPKNLAGDNNILSIDLKIKIYNHSLDRFLEIYR